MAEKRQLAVFVVMPFEGSFESVYGRGIIPIAGKIPGWTIIVERADTTAQRDPTLMGHVRALIADADLVIADISGCNANVMLEVGLVLGLQKPLALITRDDRGAVPSDLAGYLWTRYSMDDLGTLSNSLAQRLFSEIDSILRRVARIEPVGPGRTLWITPLPEPRASRPAEAMRLRQRGRAERDRGDLAAARPLLEKAISECPDFWEAKYELATVLSALKEEDRAEHLAKEVVSEATAHGDTEFAYKAHNFLSGVEKRRNRLDTALAEIRKAYELCGSLPPPRHVVVLKNRLVLESLLGNQSELSAMKREFASHPECAAIVSELRKELGDAFSLFDE